MLESRNLRRDTRMIEVLLLVRSGDVLAQAQGRE
jgi:hypothetical protein